MEWLRKLPKWVRWGLPVVVVVLLILIFWNRVFRSSETVAESRFPFIEVSGIWADSVQGTLTPEEKFTQTLIRLYEKGKGVEKGTGWWFMSDSLRTFQEVAAHIPDSSIPVFFGIEDTDPVAETGLKLASLHILSNRNDSLIFRYLDYHLAEAGKAGMNLVVFPLDLPVVNAITIRDTLFFNRLANFTGYFIRQALSTGLIPVTPMMGGILPSSEKNNLSDSVRIEAARKIYHEKVPAILLDSLPGAMVATEALRTFFREKYGFRGIILLRGERISHEDLPLAIQAGADLVITNGIPNLKVLPDAVSLNRAAGNVLYIKEWLRNQRGNAGVAGPVYPDTAAAKRLQYALLTGSVVRFQDPGKLIPIRKIPKDPLQVYLQKGKNYETFLQYLTFFTDISIRRYDNPGIIKPGLAMNALWVTEDSVVLRKLIARGDAMKGSIVVYAGQPAGLRVAGGPAAIVWAYDFRSEIQQITANFLFGGTSCNGRVPVPIGDKFLSGLGLDGFRPDRLNYTIPEAAGIHPASLLLVDSIITEAIRNGAFPGCQVFAALDGKVILNKSYGHLTYEAGSPEVTTRHLYDIASLTKAVATTPAIMKLYEKGRFRLSDKLGRYFRDHRINQAMAVRDTLIREDTLVLKGSRSRKAAVLAGHGGWRGLNDTLFLVADTLYYTFQHRRSIFDIPVRSLLTHTSGLPPGLPVARFMVPPASFQSPDPRIDFYSLTYHPDSAFLKVADGLYLRTAYRDTLWNICKALGINEKAGYVYSDVNMILLQQAIDSLTRKRMPVFLEEEIYAPLGLRLTCFNPLERFNKEDIAPTANDLRWRKQLLQGTVHDPSAALFGGCAGNAGLFSTAAELGIIGQMLLDSGSYGGKKYFDPSTVALFTSRQAPAASGLGFDIGSRAGLAAPSASPKTYGQTGFTGTVLWVDPDTRLVFVLLSNRLHPNSENQKINHMKVREKVHEALYQGILKGLKEV